MMHKSRKSSVVSKCFINNSFQPSVRGVALQGHSLQSNAVPLVVSATSPFLCRPPESCIILTFAADICSVPSPRSLDLVGQHGPCYGFPESLFPLSFNPGEAAQF